MSNKLVVADNDIADFTGTNPAYLVLREEYTLGAELWDFVLNYGAFHGKSVKLINKATNKPMKLGSDFTLNGFQEEPTMKSSLGGGVYTIISINREKYQVPPAVYIDYQRLGGKYGSNTQAILDAIKAMDGKVGDYYWSNIKGVPVAFPPSFHLTDARDIVGLNTTNTLLMNIAVGLQSLVEAQRIPEVPEFIVGADGVQKITVDKGLRLTNATRRVVISVNRTAKNDAMVGLRFNYGTDLISVRYTETASGITGGGFHNNLPANLAVSVYHNVAAKKNYICLEGTFTQNFMLLEQVICMCATPKDMLYGYTWSDAPGSGTKVVLPRI